MNRNRLYTFIQKLFSVDCQKYLASHTFEDLRHWLDKNGRPTEIHIFIILLG